MFVIKFLLPMIGLRRAKTPFAFRQIFHKENFSPDHIWFFTSITMFCGNGILASYHGEPMQMNFCKMDLRMATNLKMRRTLLRIKISRLSENVLKISVVAKNEN